MTDRFSADVDKWIRKSNIRLQAVIQQSAQDVISDAQRLRTAGGNMRLDTGFLVNSGKANIGSMPSGQSKDSGYNKQSWDNASVMLTINRVKVGDVLYFGWTANYARAREHKDGFMRLAVQKWQSFVKINADRLRRMSGGN